MSQSELFTLPQQLPSGLVYCPEFISGDEELSLIGAIQALPFREARFREYTARRRVVRFGSGDYLDAEPDQPTDIPRIEFPPFLDAPGTPIGWHRDAPHFEIVAGVSLNCACVMRFRPFEDRRRDAILTLELQPRSIYVMQNDIRWRWQHSIQPLKATRYSVTFRSLAKG